MKDALAYKYHWRYLFILQIYFVIISTLSSRVEVYSPPELAHINII